MPRRPDPELEKRVLKAATKLWHGGGDTSLSMRALAPMRCCCRPAGDVSLWPRLQPRACLPLWWPCPS